MLSTTTERDGVSTHLAASDYAPWRTAYPLKPPGKPLMMRRLCSGRGYPACRNFIRLPEFELSTREISFKFE